MITFNELLHGHLISDVPHSAQLHLEELLVAINKFRTIYGKPMTVTSGYRTQQDQARINPKAPHSKHIEGYAVDIADPDGSLYAYAKANEQVLTDCGLWCENGTKGWTHFQCVQYGSYNSTKSRFFNP